MLALLLLGTQTMTKANIQLRITKGKKRPEKTIKMYFTVISKCDPIKKVLKKNYKNLGKFPNIC